MQPSAPQQVPGPSSSEPPSFFLRNDKEVRINNVQKEGNSRQVLTNRNFYPVLRLLKVLLNKFQVKVELDMFLFQLSVTGHELATFL